VTAQPRIMPRRRSDEEDDDDYEPVYRGGRNYEGPGASFADGAGDFFDAVKKGAGELAEGIKETTLSLTEKVGQEVEKVTRQWDGKDEEQRQPQPGWQQRSGDSRKVTDEVSGSRRMLGNMPPGCFCDMRGYACPIHRGQEAWRFSQDFRSHVQHNVDPDNASARAVGIAGGDAKIIKEVVMVASTAIKVDSASQRWKSAVGVGRGGTDSSGRSPPSSDSTRADPTDRYDPHPTHQSPSEGSVPRQSATGADSGRRGELDEIMAQLCSMGFDPDRVARALEARPNLEGATNLLLDDPHSDKPAALTRLPNEGSMGAVMGALPTGWHACTDPTHNRTYFYNTVTQQSQWIRPIAAAAVPFEAMPTMSTAGASVAEISPTTRKTQAMAAGAQFGGVGDMAANMGLRVGKWGPG